MTTAPVAETVLDRAVLAAETAPAPTASEAEDVPGRTVKREAIVQEPTVSPEEAALDQNATREVGVKAISAAPAVAASIQRSSSAALVLALVPGAGPIPTVLAAIIKSSLPSSHHRQVMVRGRRRNRPV